MKTLNQYIEEKLIINKNSKKEYNYYPTTRDELKELIEQLIKERGNNANLNDIDTSEITDMYRLFQDSKFNGDISGWDVSNVEDMEEMFYQSEFNGDISKWNVSKVENMKWMFSSSKFNKDISEWKINKNATNENNGGV